MVWWYWALIGLTLLGLEVLTLGGLGNFYFLFFGVAALVVSAIVWSGLAGPVWLQWVLFSLFGVMLLVLLRKGLHPATSSTNQPQDQVDTLVGEVATIAEDLPGQAAGKAELRGSNWTVRNAGSETLRKGQRAEVIHVDGLTLLVQAESPLKKEGPHVR